MLGWSMWVPSVAMMLANVLSYVDRQVLAVLSPTILHDTGLSGEAYTQALLGFSIFYMIGNPLWGSLLDFIGLRKGMFAAVSVRAVASSAHAAMSGFWGFAAARSVLGFGEGSAFPGALKAASDSLPPNRQSRGMAIGYSGASLGAILTPLLVTPIALRFGWHSAFLVTGAMSLVWLALWAVIGRPPFMEDYRSTSLKVTWPDFRERRLWLVVSSFGLGAVALGIVSNLSPLYLNRAMGLTQARLGQVLWVPLVGWEAGYYFWGWVADKLVTPGKRPAGLFCLLAVLALPSGLIAMTSSLSLVLALMFWATFVADGFVVLSMRVGSHLYPRDQVAMVGGIGSGSWSAVVGIVQVVYGHWLDKHWYSAMWISMCLLPAAGTGLWLLLSRTLYRTLEEPQPVH